jgi:rhamnose utilization protein RhaD (predicted bifunctional aldolase and dehydrogenase)
MPAIRGFVSENHNMTGHFIDNETVLEFVNSTNLKPLAALGTSCPDHFLRTKIRPLVVNFNPEAGNIDEVLDNLPGQIAAYRDDYTAYYNRCKN